MTFGQLNPGDRFTVTENGQTVHCEKMYNTFYHTGEGSKIREINCRVVPSVGITCFLFVGDDLEVCKVQ